MNLGSFFIVQLNQRKEVRHLIDYFKTIIEEL